MNRRETIARVVRKFGSKRTELGKTAFRLMKFHIRMADYIEQAPVIVAMCLKQHRTIPVQGGIQTSFSAFDDKRLNALCHSGAKLRDVLAVFEINAGLRGLEPEWLDGSTLRMVKHFVGANISTVSQQMKKRSPRQQIKFMEEVRDWGANVRDPEGVPTTAWMIEQLPVSEDIDLRHILDLYRARPEWKPHWKWRDHLAHMRKWEESFTQPQDADLTAIAALQNNNALLMSDPVRYMTYVGMDLARRGNDTATEIALRQQQSQQLANYMSQQLDAQMYNALSQQSSQQAALQNAYAQRIALQQQAFEMTLRYQRLRNADSTLRADPTLPLSPHKDMPEEEQYPERNLWITLLNTEQALQEEGSTLSHCVGGYGPHVKSGRSLIYSIREMDPDRNKSKATMELIKYRFKKRDGQDVQTWYIEQIKGYKNHKPNAEVYGLAEAFAKKHFIIEPKPQAMAGDWEEVRYYPRLDPERQGRQHAERPILRDRDFQDRVISYALRELRAEPADPQLWDTTIRVAPDGRELELQLDERVRPIYRPFDPGDATPEAEVTMQRPQRHRYIVNPDMLRITERETHEARAVSAREMRAVDFLDRGRLPWTRPRDRHEAQVHVEVVTPMRPVQFNDRYAMRLARPSRGILGYDGI